MSQAPRKPNTTLTILWFAAALFLGFSFLFNKQPPDKRTGDQVMAAIQAQANDVREKAAKNSISISDALKQNTEPDLQSANANLSVQQDWAQMQILNGLVCDISIAAVENQFERKVDEDKTLSKDQKDLLKLQGQMLQVDTEMKSAAQRNELRPSLITANDLIIKAQRNDSSQAGWDIPIQVNPTKQYPATQITPRQLEVEAATLSNNLGKDTPVYGFFPGYQMVDFLVHMTGAIPGFSYWFECLLLAVFVRAIIWPLSQRQMMWSRQMSQLSPLINEIKEKFKGKSDAASQQEQQKRIMDLYKEYGMNPMAGCLPAFLQLPLFWLIYQSMLHYRFEFQKGTFLWINPATSAWTHGFFARNLGERDNILIVAYGITMVSTALLAPINDPSNARQQRLMGVSISALFGIMMFWWPVPSAFILYWTFTNMLATTQSLRANRLPLPPLVKKNAPNGGVFPITGPGAPHAGKEGRPLPGTNGQLNGKPKSTGAPKVHKPKKRK